ncbi:outer membrane protein transport protein [Vibrio agarivorans]|uniref:Outer membrane protein transport protein n=1 Tax=Vibrio agarivorans TaxID=153622 RepID=A0ABT7Y0T8_9VIBR|nr:outer membrane protein transport protein [Vibrio agarivorans]MDN2481635.1 outer membrane protein transport protein [Vibrio agarivorans]
MKNMRLFKKSVVAVTVALASQQAVAAGFQLNAQSATGIGRAFAGDAVIADNASVMARNPAAMALFDSMELSLGFETIITDIEVKDIKVLGQPVSSLNTDDVGSTSVAPNIHLIVPVNEKFAWGINAYSNFGTRTEFNNGLQDSIFGGETDVKSVNFGLAGSYRLNEQWSFGAGLDLIYGKGTLKRGGKIADIPGGDVLPAGAKLVDIDGADGWGVGFNIGTVYELNDNNRFGLSYRYSPEITAEDGNKEIKLPLPDMVEFSGYHRLEDTKFAVHYSVQWIGWSAFDKIEFKNASTGLPPQLSPTEAVYEWQDGWHYAIGGTYYLNNDWTLRAGYMHDTSAQDKITSISVPDSNRNWFSGGFTYHINQKSNVDFGFTYLVGEDTDVVEGSGLLTATTRADAILVGLQYSRSF